jgi:hypothetical protein
VLIELSDIFSEDLGGGLVGAALAGNAPPEPLGDGSLRLSKPSGVDIFPRGQWVSVNTGESVGPRNRLASLRERPLPTAPPSAEQSDGGGDLHSAPQALPTTGLEHDAHYGIRHDVVDHTGQSVHPKQRLNPAASPGGYLAELGQIAKINNRSTPSERQLAEQRSRLRSTRS